MNLKDEDTLINMELELDNEDVSDYDFINNDLILKCEYNDIEDIKDLLKSPLIDISYDNFSALKMACWNNNEKIIDLLLEKNSRIVLENSDMTFELVTWCIFDNNMETWKILRKHFVPHEKLLYEKMIEIPELKHLQDEEIPESKVQIYIPFKYQFLEYIIHMINWPIIGRLIRWFI